MSNLRPAPMNLTRAVVAKLVGDQPAYGKSLVRIPLEGQLVDQPNPRLCKLERVVTKKGKTRWCDQCDARIAPQQVQNCQSRFCSLQPNTREGKT